MNYIVNISLYQDWFFLWKHYLCLFMPYTKYYSFREYLSCFCVNHRKLRGGLENKKNHSFRFERRLLGMFNMKVLFTFYITWSWFFLMRSWGKLLLLKVILRESEIHHYYRLNLFFQPANRQTRLKLAPKPRKKQKTLPAPKRHFHGPRHPFAVVRM